MKKLLITTVAITAFASSAGAMEAKDRNPTDPLYQPMEGKYYFDVDLQAFERKYDRYNATTSALYDHREKSGISSFANLRYGVADSFSLDLGIGYTIYKEAVTPLNIRTTSYHHMGWENPYIGVTYKLFDNKSGVVQFGAKWTINAFDAQRSSSPEYDGSVASGRHELEGFLRYGKDWKWFTIAPEVIARYVDTERYVILNGDQNYKYEDTMQYEYRLNHEIRMGRDYSMNLNISYIDRDERDYTNSAGAAGDREFRENEGNLLIGKVQANMHFSDTFTLSGYYEYQNVVGDETSVTPQATGGAIPLIVYDNETTQKIGIKTIFGF